jgi:hypothetical protein
MKKPNELYTGISCTSQVDEFLNALEHPMLDTLHELRKVILAADKNIGEGIFWNAPTFYFTGKLEDFDPKTYKRYIVGFNFYKKDEVRLVFLHGANANDKTGLLTGDYKDGRRLASFKSSEEVKQKEAALKKVIKELVKQMK